MRLLLRRAAADLGRPLGSAAYRRVWIAQVLSELGDHAARLALSMLVYGAPGRRRCCREWDRDSSWPRWATGSVAGS